MSALVAQPGISSPTSEEHFRIALNIARMEALNTLYVAAAIRDEKGNPTREAIFAANRILSFSMHHDRRASAGDARSPAPSGGAVERSETEGAAISFPAHPRPTAPAPASPNLPQGGGGGGAAGGGSCLSSGSSSSSSSSVTPSQPGPLAPAPASPNLPQGGGPAAGGGGGSGIPTAFPSAFSASPSSPRIDIQLDIRPPSPRPTPPASTLTKLPHGESVEQAKRRETEGAPAFSSPSTSPPPPTPDIAVGATACSPPPSSPTPSPTQSLVTDTFSGSAIPTSELRIPHAADLTTIAEQAINCLRQELNLSDEQVAALRADPVAWLNEYLPEYMTDDPPDEITALEAALLTGTADDG